MGSRSASKAVTEAIESFAQGYAVTRSRAHPCLVDQIDGIWRMRDAPRKNDKDYRREEWVAYQKDPKDVDRIVRANTRGHFAICAIRGNDESTGALRDAYKSIGYRLGGTEPLFVHDLAAIPTAKSPATIERILTRELADKFGKAAHMKPMPSELLVKAAPIRQYVALVGEAIVGSVCSIVVGKRTWVTALHVFGAHRRKGIGRALMAKMLRDDRAAGSNASVLLASHTGAKLYPLLGYEQIGELLMLTPKRR